MQNIFLVTDFDGTFIPDNKIISEYDLEAVNKFRNKGGLFTIATGRTIQSMKNYFNVLNPEMPIILYNGAMIYDSQKDKVLFCRTLDSSSKEIVKNILERFPFIGCEILKKDGIYIVHNNEYEQHHTDICKVKPIYCDIDELDGNDWIKVLFAFAPEESGQIWKFISEKYSNINFLNSSGIFIELLPENTSKGSTLKIYRELLNIPSETKIIAAGDYDNDIEMLEYADIGIVPSNACEEAKKNADIILEKSCNENAMAEIIKYIFTEVV